MSHKIDLPTALTTKEGFLTYDLSPELCELLLREALAAMKFTFPEANDGYSVAILTDRGNIVTGASYKSDTHNTTMHAEAVALARAAQSGETRIVAITGPNCHNCKQLIWESSIRSKLDTKIIIKAARGIKQVPISELMPYPWPGRDLKH